jgi:hypothetical protein
LAFPFAFPPPAAAFPAPAPAPAPSKSPSKPSNSAASPPPAAFSDTAETGDAVPAPAARMASSTGPGGMPNFRYALRRALVPAPTDLL